MGIHKRVAEWETIALNSVPSTYNEAVSLGSAYYFDKSCQRGHTVPRRTKYKDCPKCTQMRDRGELTSTGALVKVFNMLVDLSKRQVGFRGLQDSKQVEEEIDYVTEREFDNEIASRCPFDG